MSYLTAGIISIRYLKGKQEEESLKLTIEAAMGEVLATPFFLGGRRVIGQLTLSISHISPAVDLVLGGPWESDPWKKSAPAGIWTPEVTIENSVCHYATMDYDAILGVLNAGRNFFKSSRMYIRTSVLWTCRNDLHRGSWIFLLMGDLKKSCCVKKQEGNNETE